MPECTKLFKGVDFWRKHVEKRHTEWYDRVRSDVELVNTYVLDPAHIAPSRSDANSNGHFPLGNNVLTGTPRGFQLPQQFGMSFPGTPAMAAPNIQPGMTPGPPFNFPGWAGMPNPQAMPGVTTGFGPMRNHGRGVGNGRMPGPYDSRNRPGGRMPSISGGRPGMLPGMFGTGAEGGVVSIGPPESMAGRPIKSYEDLDAAGDKGTGELDY